MSNFIIKLLKSILILGEYKFFFLTSICNILLYKYKSINSRIKNIQTYFQNIQFIKKHKAIIYEWPVINLSFRPRNNLNTLIIHFTYVDMCNQLFPQKRRNLKINISSLQANHKRSPNSVHIDANSA